VTDHTPDPTVGHERVDTTKSLADPAQGAAHDVPVFVDLVGGLRACMLTTLDHDGAVVSRPMAVQRVDEDATVWFFAFSDAPKIAQIQARPQVNLTFTDGDTYVSASGVASLVDDDAMKRELWNPFAKAWFQCEPENPAVALIRVDPRHGEYWDSPNKPAQVIGLVRGLLGHGTPADGDNAKLDLG